MSNHSPMGPSTDAIVGENAAAEPTERQPPRLRAAVTAPTRDKRVSEWIVDYCASSSYQDLVAQLQRRFADRASFTAFNEMALLYSLVRCLKPQLCLEVGTLFADTSRVLAEAIVDGNCPTKLVTIDPFGAHRVPGIITGWPDDLQKVVEYKPISSMDFFLELENARIPTGSASPLGLVFVDGHHALQYALFDILSAASSLKPGGVIVIDNLEQDGPRSAAVMFLQWNPAWALYFDGKLIDEASAEASISQVNDNWGALIAPEGIQVSFLPSKLYERNLPNRPIHGIKFNITKISKPGTLHFNLIYLGVPDDFHITGKGLENRRVVSSLEFSLENPNSVANFDPLVLEVPEGAAIVCEIELRYEGERNSFVLLSPEEPFTLMAAD